MWDIGLIRRIKSGPVGSLPITKKALTVESLLLIMIVGLLLVIVEPAFFRQFNIFRYFIHCSKPDRISGRTFVVGVPVGIDHGEHPRTVGAFAPG